MQTADFAASLWRHMRHCQQGQGHVSTTTQISASPAGTSPPAEHAPPPASPHLQHVCCCAHKGHAHVGDLVGCCQPDVLTVTRRQQHWLVPAGRPQPHKLAGEHSYTRTVTWQHVTATCARQPLRHSSTKTAKSTLSTCLRPPTKHTHTSPHLYACGTCTRLISCTVWLLSACPSTLVELSTCVTRTLRLPSSTWMTRPGGTIQLCKETGKMCQGKPEPGPPGLWGRRGGDMHTYSLRNSPEVLG